METEDPVSIEPQPFRARFPWIGADLQTLRYRLRPGGRPDLAAWPGERLEIALSDGSGDRLAARLHRTAVEAGRPLAILVHGLTGSEDSGYLRTTSRHLLSHGYPVLRLNQRGAGPGRPMARSLYHAGRSEDLRDAVTAVLARHPRLTAPGVVLVGYSLGGNVLLKMMGEADLPDGVRAAVAVSAPLDLKTCQERLMAPRNRVYQAYLLKRMRRERLAGPVPDEALRRAMFSLRSILDYDEAVAPLNGFENAAVYYERCSATRFLPDIKVPSLAIHAGDDPWIPLSCYRAIDWSKLPAVRLALSSGGGHVGFHGQGSRVPWHDQRILAFFEEQFG